MFLLFGLAFPAVSYWLSRPAIPFTGVNKSTPNVIPALVFLLFLITIYLTMGPEKINSAMHVYRSSPKLFAILTLGQKITFFVLIPMLLLSRQFGLSPRDFGVQWNVRSWLAKRHVRILLGLTSALIVFQYYAGQAAAPIRDGHFSGRQLSIGLPLAYLWLLLEVGLVEEFFFRAVVQSRVAAYLKSDVSGVLIASLLFGLAHAPGLILRGGGVDSPVGSNPSALFAICYSVAVLSAAGLFLGIVWARTRNLFLVVMIHAAVDLLPNFSKFIETWGLR